MLIKHKEQRVGVFVDVQNMYHSAKNLYNCRANFKEILRAATANRKLIRAFAYVIRIETSEERIFKRLTGPSIGIGNMKTRFPSFVWNNKTIEQCDFSKKSFVSMLAPSCIY